MNRNIHRKKTDLRIKETLDTARPEVWFSRQDLSDALEVIESQQELLGKFGQKINKFRRLHKHMCELYVQNKKMMNRWHKKRTENNLLVQKLCNTILKK